MGARMAAKISLDGKVAIVTGASRGIGEAIARTFAAHGAKVVLASRKIDGLLAVAESIDKEHGPKTAIAVAAHTGKESDCAALVARAISELGRVDVLVNNAATNPFFGPMLDIENSAWDKTFDVNTKGYFWMARDVAKHLRGRDAPGSIVNIASVAGLVAAPMQGVYGMTKAAVIAMTRTLAVELGSSKIRVNAIAPGLVDTKLASAITSNDALADYFTKRAPAGRWGVPDEIAGGALYLASDSASFVTGHTLVIDGGMTIG
jgi:NAD(P)-dependent dehydrogenase (short-subunit alcohol dehydrogenase family)